MLNCLSEWKKTKQDFEKITGKKKPAEKTLGVFRRSSGIESALKKCDKHTKVSPHSDKTFKSYKSDFTKLEKTIKEYITLLDSSIKKEKENQDDDVKTVLEKGLKMLKRKLEHCLSRYEDDLNNAQTLLKTSDPVEGMIRTQGSKLKTGVASALSTAAKIKASPTVETWNASMMKGTRILTTALKGYAQIVQMARLQPNQIDANTQKWITKADQHIRILTPYATSSGNKVTLPNDTDENRVKTEIKTYATLIKQVKSDFKV
ncbi:Hypothetical protein PBC10988_28590 [Planctomycetales bacterium 10988]|nr:Hypothetical protein PBC10988_28590 [Planctomycetales bacterium 10988]